MSSPPDDITIGEVYRLLLDVKEDVGGVKGDVKSLDHRFDGMEKQRLEPRIKALENLVGWGARIIVGSVIAALLSLVLLSGGVLA